VKGCYSWKPWWVNLTPGVEYVARSYGGWWKLGPPSQSPDIHTHFYVELRWWPYMVSQLANKLMSSDLGSFGGVTNSESHVSGNCASFSSHP